MLRRKSLEQVRQMSGIISDIRKKAMSPEPEPEVQPTLIHDDDISHEPLPAEVDGVKPSNEANALMGNSMLQEFIAKNSKKGSAGAGYARQEEKVTEATFGGYPNLRWRRTAPANVSLRDELRHVKPERTEVKYDTGKTHESHTFLGLLGSTKRKTERADRDGSIEPGVIARFLDEDKAFAKVGLFQQSNYKQIDKKTHPQEWLEARKKALGGRKKDFGQGQFLASHIERDIKAASAVVDLIAAVRFGRLDEVIMLCLLGTPLNVLGQDDRSPLMEAAVFGQTEILEYLLDLGADVNLRSSYGSSGLLYAAQHSRDDIMVIMIERGADVNAGDFRGLAPLHWCAKTFVKMSTILKLLDYNANMDAQDIRGNTPLHYACEFGKFEVVLPLLKAGASMDIKNKSGRSPEDVCPSGMRLMLKERLDSHKKQKEKAEGKSRKNSKGSTDKRLSRKSMESVGSARRSHKMSVSSRPSTAGRSSATMGSEDSVLSERRVSRKNAKPGGIIAQVDKIMNEGYDFRPGSKDSLSIHERTKKLPSEITSTLQVKDNEFQLLENKQRARMSTGDPGADTGATDGGAGGPAQLRPVA